MNGKRAKAIRRALRQELAESGTRYITHAEILPRGIKYTFQYVSTKGRRMYKTAKRIYQKHGLLPK